MLVIESVQYHRNGIGGQGFHAVTFTDTTEQRKMIGVVFPKDKPKDTFNPNVAVFDRELVGAGEIGFGVNSWRGDHYADVLQAACDLSGGEWVACAIRNGHTYFTPQRAYTETRKRVRTARCLMQEAE